jgi:hypothetical protein
MNVESRQGGYIPVRLRQGYGHLTYACKGTPTTLGQGHGEFFSFHLGREMDLLGEEWLSIGKDQDWKRATLPNQSV